MWLQPSIHGLLDVLVVDEVGDLLVAVKEER